jgi:hypothetical protein
MEILGRRSKCAAEIELRKCWLSLINLQKHISKASNCLNVVIVHPQQQRHFGYCFSLKLIIWSHDQDWRRDWDRHRALENRHDHRANVPCRPISHPKNPVHLLQWLLVKPLFKGSNEYVWKRVLASVTGKFGIRVHSSAWGNTRLGEQFRWNYAELYGGLSLLFAWWLSGYWQE